MNFTVSIISSLTQRSTLYLLLSLSLFCVDTRANESSGSYTVGISVWSGYPQSVNGFKDALTQAGLIEEENVTYLYRNAESSKEKQISIAEEFRDKNVDLVYSLTTPGTIIVKQYMPDSTPIVFSIVTYPADAGLIESFDYSGNNLVGTSNFVELKHYVKLLKDVLPEVTSVAIFRRKGEPNSKIQAVNLERLLRRENVEVIHLQASTTEEVALMAADIAASVDAFISTTDTLMQGGGERQLINVSQLTKTPILSSNKQGIFDGSTLGPVADFYVLGKMSGEKAAMILKKKLSPSSLESSLQNPPNILVNRRSLEHQGLTLPSDHSTYIFIN